METIATSEKKNVVAKSYEGSPKSAKIILTSGIVLVVIIIGYGLFMVFQSLAKVANSIGGVIGLPTRFYNSMDTNITNMGKWFK